MNKTKLAVILALFAFLLFGCINIQGDQPQAKLTGAVISDKNHDFLNFSVNTTSDAFSLNGVLTKHAYQIVYNCPPANVTLQGSLDNANWANLSTVDGNTTNITFVIDKPVVAVRIAVTDYTGSTNSSVQNLTVRYVGTS